MSVLEQQGADSLHQVKLQMYCRLCGEYQEGMPNDKLRFQDDLQRYLRVDVCADAPSIHPGKFCKGCMSYLKRLKSYQRRNKSLKEPRKTAVFRPHCPPCRICDSTQSESPCKRSRPPEVPAPGPSTLPSGAQPDDGVKAKMMRRSSAENIEGDKWPSVSDSGPSYSRKLAPTPATSSDVEPSPSTSRGEPSTSSTGKAVSHTGPSLFPAPSSTRKSSHGKSSTPGKAVTNAGLAKSSVPTPSTSRAEPSSTGKTASNTADPSCFLQPTPVQSTSHGMPTSLSKAVSHSAAGASHHPAPSSTPSTSHGKSSSAVHLAVSKASSLHFPQATSVPLLSTCRVEPNSTNRAISNAGPSHFSPPTPSNNHVEPCSTSKPSEAETITTIKLIKCNSTPLFKFVSKTQANVFLCEKGTGVACNPRLTPCGHLFCYDCIRASLASANRCPKCQRTTYANQLRALDDCLVTLYYNLKVSCMYGEKGCVQNVVLRDLRRHEEKCSFREEEHSLPRDSETHTDKRRCRGKGKAKVPLSECSSQYAKRQRLPYIISSVDRFCSDHLEDKKDVLFFMLLNHLRETHDRRSSNLYNMWMAGDVDIEEEAPPVPRNQTCGICHEAGHNRKTCPNT